MFPAPRSPEEWPGRPPRPAGKIVPTAQPLGATAREMERWVRVAPMRRRKEKIMTTATKTTDHETIRAWAEARGGQPARVEGTGEGGILRIDFNEPEERLTPIEWDEFFQVFEDNNLAFLFQEETADGSTSRFGKFVDRDA